MFGNHLMFDRIDRYTADGNSIYGENSENINELFKFNLRFIFSLRRYDQIYFQWM